MRSSIPDANRLRRLCFAVVVCALAAPAGSSVAARQSPPSFVATGLQPNRGYFAQVPFERIDMVLGDLSLVFEDLVLPGSGGLDLRFVRTYSRNRDWAPWPTYNKWAFGLAGIPWRVVHPTPYQVGDEGQIWPSLSMGDGGTQRMFPTGDPYASTVYVGDDFSQFDTNTRVLTMPNGWRATYEQGNPLGGAALVGVQDPYGNSITPTWGPLPLPANRTAWVMTAVTQIISGQTRVVEFEYSADSGRMPTKMKYHDGFQERQWLYSFESGNLAALTSVTPPTGSGWSIEYPVNGLKITTPAGGWVSYNFAEQANPEPGLLPNYVVSSRTTGGPSVAGGTWQFAFNFTTQIGVVYAPNAVRVEYRHTWEPYFQRWQFDRKWLFKNDVEVARYEVDSILLGQAGQPFPAEERLVRDGRTYTTVHSYAANDAAHHWGDYGRASTQTETGDLTRVITRTFDYSFDGQLGNFSRVQSQTVAVAGESFTTAGEFEDATGFQTWQSDLGIPTTFGRDSGGNAAAMTDAMGHATSIPHQWGVPASITTPEYTVTRGINPDGTTAWEQRQGLTTAFTYDALGRVTSASPPEGAATLTSYAADGRSVTVSRGPTWIRTDLDGFGRPVGTENAAGVKTLTQYDSEGRKT